MKGPINVGTGGRGPQSTVHIESHMSSRIFLSPHSMARGLGKASVRQNSNKKKNETGYLHRISRKSKKDSVNSEDVYEYTPGRTRRAKISMELDRSEVADGRYAQYDDKPLDARAQLIGENIDDEMIDSDDDEEIDSDAAFEESDEEKFAGFFSSKPVSRTIRHLVVAHTRLS